MNKPILFLDMDDVLVNFKSSKRIPLHEKHIYNHPNMYQKDFFLELEPMKGAINFVNKLEKEGFWDIHILTQPVSKSSSSYSEKADWITKYLPYLSEKITMTQDKILVSGHVLIDDNPKWENFTGYFILFNPKEPLLEWERIKFLLNDLKRDLCNDE